MHLRSPLSIGMVSWDSIQLFQMLRLLQYWDRQRYHSGYNSFLPIICENDQLQLYIYGHSCCCRYGKGLANTTPIITLSSRGLPNQSNKVISKTFWWKNSTPKQRCTTHTPNPSQNNRALNFQGWKITQPHLQGWIQMRKLRKGGKHHPLPPRQLHHKLQQ